MTFAESRGLGVRVIRDAPARLRVGGRSPEDEIARDGLRGRERTPRSPSPDEHNGLPAAEPFEPMPEIFREQSVTVAADDKVRLALSSSAYAVSRDPRVSKVDLAQVGDAVSRVAIASTTGVDVEYARTDAWAVVVTLAVDGDETQTGFSYAIARGLDALDWEPVADEAVERAVKMLGAVKPRRPPSSPSCSTRSPHRASSACSPARCTPRPS